MFLPREVLTRRLAEAEAALPRQPAGWPQQTAEAGIEMLRADIAALDMVNAMAAALEMALEQIGQMRGMFDDGDGGIAAAVDAGEKVLTEWTAVRNADRIGYYGKPVDTDDREYDWTSG